MCARFFYFILFSFILGGCVSKHRDHWSVVVAANNSKYEQAARLLQELFSKKGLTLEMIHVANSVEAARTVARGKADFTFSLSHSGVMIPRLGKDAGEIRTVMPLFENALFVFYRTPTNIESHPRSIIELLDHGNIFLEVQDTLAEQYIGLKRVLDMLNVAGYKFVKDSAEATVIPVWGTFSGVLTRQMLEKKWTLYSMEEAFIDYATIIEPRLSRLTIPVRYTGKGTKEINTLLSTAYLITGAHVDRTELYDVISMLYEHRVDFMSSDMSYRAIRENFDVNDLNYPLHAAAANFLRRNEPTFLERHAEYYGLIISALILVFGIIQSMRNYIARKKKDRIDLYFQEYLTIKKDPALSTIQRVERLEALHEKAIHQMILEKLDITDFNVFSKAIESERLILTNPTSEKIHGAVLSLKKLENSSNSLEYPELSGIVRYSGKA